MPRDERVYVDHNATTPVDPRVASAMTAILAGNYGNPSSVHAEGRRARGVVERARRQVAALIGAQTETLVFTSGGTEADALGVLGLANVVEARNGPRVIALPGIEHPAVIGAAASLVGRGWTRVDIPVGDDAVVDIAALRASCGDGLVGIIAVAVANHEVGTVQDIPAIVDVARETGALVHVDAVQAAGKIAIDVAALGVDTLAISSHKIYGPKGVGALYARAGLDLAPMFPGGHQERERRPGTENVVGIVGFGVAAELAHSGLAEVVLRERFEAGLVAIDGASVNAANVERVPNTSSVRFEGALAETVVAGLDLAGFAVSTGAACTSGTTEPSKVLLAMGRSEREATECVRFSFGRGNTMTDVDGLLAVLPDIVARARAFE